MNKKVAFICMEFSIEKLPTYAGGLGILSGDLFYTANDLGIPFYGITFISRRGYVKYKIKDKELIIETEDYDPIEYFSKIDETYSIKLKNLEIKFDVWKYSLPNAKLYLIDTNRPDNPDWIRELTDRLYFEKNEEEKLLKDILLGLGTLEIFDKQGIEIDKYHLNESHGGFLAIELFKRYNSIEDVRKKVVFTTHSIVAGHDEFSYDLVEKYYNIPDEIRKISPNKLSLTKVLFELSGKKNAVSFKHREATKKLFGVDLDYITNGVYHFRWINRKIANLYDIYLPGWKKEPAKLAYADYIPDSEFYRVRSILKEELINFINTESYQNKSFSHDRILISVRRRLVEYKRFHMPLWRLELFEELNKKYKIQFLISGAFHPADTYVQNTVKWIIDVMSTLNTPIALILKRGIELEKYIISGTDIFLHIPRPPLEASGTSWMRAAINGVPVLASKDGSVVEGIIDGYNGWLFGKNRIYLDESYNEDEDVLDFYRKLEEAFNLYRYEHREYLRICKNAIKTIGPIFNTYRVLREYIRRMYE
ncbi:MAG: alpha-glucan family phosphorylase [Nanopusillaceae archaeon]